ncbi:MAG: hypothetical protein HY644_15670 [Acidobacteria bacterium]|nr:hypothetical protein [Acidobacteriota bacterium]
MAYPPPVLAYAHAALQVLQGRNLTLVAALLLTGQGLALDMPAIEGARPSGRACRRLFVLGLVKSAACSPDTAGWMFLTSGGETEEPEAGVAGQAQEVARDGQMDIDLSGRKWLLTTTRT